MKLTKKQLRRIIKEEREKLLRESLDDRINPDLDDLEQAGFRKVKDDIDIPEFSLHQHEPEDVEAAIEATKKFMSSESHPTFDGLVKYLANNSWYDESYAADMIEQMIMNGHIHSNHRGELAARK